MHLSARETGLTGTKSGESLEDGAERGEGGRHRERSMHASLDQAKFFFGQSGTMGRVQVYIVNTPCCCGQNRVQFYFSVRHAPRTPSDWLGGSVLGLLLLLYTHIMHTYISDHRHQVAAGSSGNTIDLALLSTGINEEYIKVSIPVKHSTKALNTTSNSSWKILPRTPHIPKL